MHMRQMSLLSIIADIVKTASVDPGTSIRNSALASIASFSAVVLLGESLRIECGSSYPSVGAWWLQVVV